VASQNYGMKEGYIPEPNEMAMFSSFLQLLFFKREKNYYTHYAKQKCARNRTENTM